MGGNPKLFVRKLKETPGVARWNEINVTLNRLC